MGYQARGITRNTMAFGSPSSAMRLPQHPSRKPLRLQNHEYRGGWFFVTICTAERAPILGSIVGVAMRPSRLGELVNQCWLEIPRLHAGTSLDEFAMMPDHLHGILARDPSGSGDACSRTLGSVIGAFKSRVSRVVGPRECLPHKPIWQRGFYDRVVRGEPDLLFIRRYIRENALATTVPPRTRSR